MRTILKTNILIALFIIANHWAFGQTEPTLNKEVDVIKAYQPNISDAQKIMHNPSINDTVNYVPEFEYRIFSNDIEVEKTINHLPVVKLGTPPTQKPNTGYAKAGFGNAITPYAEVFVNTSPNRNVDFGLHLFHYSSQAKVMLSNQLLTKAPYNNNMAKIFVKNQFRKAVLDWDLSFNREGFTYYGFPGTDSLLYQSHLISSTVLNSKQAFNNAAANFNLRNTQSRTNFDYNMNLGYNYFWSFTGQTAHNAGFNGLFTTRYRKFNMNYDTHFAFNQQSNINHYFDSTLNSRHFFELGIKPYVAYSKGNIELRAGINLESLINADSVFKFHISPKIDFAYHPIRDMLTIFAGIDGGFKPNAYPQAVKQNPYMNYMYDMKPSEEVISFYGGLKGKISRRFSYMFDVNYAINKNDVFYYLSETRSATDTIVNNLFDVEYDDVNVLRFGGNLRYSSEKVIVELKGNYYMHEAKNLTTLSLTPEFDASLFANVYITKQISTTLNAKLVGPREAVYRIYETSTSRNEIFNLPMFIDISLGADYEFSNDLKFFINASNLINRKQEFWHGYNTPRLVIMLGARYTF